MILLFITILLFIIYSILIVYYWQGWLKMPEYNLVENESLQTKVSIIIPARNEEGNIGRLLQSLQRQTYPKALTEIIVVNDHSTDGTANVVNQFSNVQLVSFTNELINSYKKKAIETGIAAANGELIITTDADCIAGENWLYTIVSFYKKNDSAFIAAPVTFTENVSNKLLYYFQVLDFLTLQGITGVSVYKKMLSMSNGANLAYRKDIFYQVNGFNDIDNIASGDDMLLMHKIKTAHPDQVHYIKSKEAIVQTAAANSWNEFFNQRIRWASKANKYDDKRIFFVLLLVYLFNLSFLVLLIAGFFNHQLWLYLAILWLAKTIIEFPFVYSVASFFNRRSLMKYFFFFQPLHIAYTIIAGWLGQFGSYEWKGRKVK
ncbi:MAG: glycosyltransferase [Chitinophagaceae bacterium]